ncbi:hypothetical protein [Carboxydothermus pertinax]|uniref:Uncharacterized protein n=1 Tax=Carboxydothermus pertinax TaxID=870242 RepID=A0A1L8CU86_9THEO|nr:hypothetical protein [Carboxydothermus pertinax]GAV22480.1 hypothetical protein cpu_09900 [Carboxydothermus pertinax]
MLKKFVGIILVLTFFCSTVLAEQPITDKNQPQNALKFLIIVIEDFSQEKLFKSYLPNIKNLYEMGYSGITLGNELNLQEYIEDLLKLKGFETNFPLLAKKYGYRVYAYGFNIKNYSGLEYLPSLQFMESKFGDSEKNGFILAFKRDQEKLADKVVEKLYESGELRNTIVVVIGSGKSGVFTTFANKIKKNVKVEFILDDGIIPTISLALGIYPQEEWGPTLWSAIYTGDWETENQNRAKEQKEILAFVLKLRKVITEKDREIKNFQKEKEKLLTKLMGKEHESTSLHATIKKLKLKIVIYKLTVFGLIITGFFLLFLEYKLLKKKYLIF